jgi:ABC-type Fe3+/spermidine/putrescine transport system ATPase subunit
VNLLEVEGLSFVAGGRRIVDRVSLTAAAGQRIAVRGPWGCAKTTLLRLVAGLERPSEGRVVFGGEDVTTQPAHRRGFGLMFQDHALFPHLDTAGNIEFGLRALHWDSARRKARISELLELVGLSGFEKRSIERLSGGERQRVALARALAPAPRLLMLDEPLASLDRELRERLVRELREILSRLELPVLYVTHDQTEAFAIADRLCIMNAGRIVRSGTPQEIWEEPRTEFVARFLGLTNIVDGKRRADGVVETAFGDFGPLPGPAAAVRVLLRQEREAAENATNVATGLVTGTWFEGDVLRVELAAGDERLEVRIPAESPLAAGATIRLSFAEAQLLNDSRDGGQEGGLV